MDSATLTADLAALIADMPGELTVGSTTFDAAFSEVSESQRLELTGEIQEVDFRVTFPLTSLGDESEPASGDAVVATPPGQSAKSCRVANRSFLQDGISMILDLSLDRRNAFPANPIQDLGNNLMQDTKGAPVEGI